MSPTVVVLLNIPEGEQAADKADLMNYTGLPATATPKELAAAALNKLLAEVRSQKAVSTAAATHEPWGHIVTLLAKSSRISQGWGACVPKRHYSGV